MTPKETTETLHQIIQELDLTVLTESQDFPGHDPDRRLYL